MVCLENAPGVCPFPFALFPIVRFWPFCISFRPKGARQTTSVESKRGEREYGNHNGCGSRFCTSELRGVERAPPASGGWRFPPHEWRMRLGARRLRGKVEFAQNGRPPWNRRPSRERGPRAGPRKGLIPPSWGRRRRRGCDLRAGDGKYCGPSISGAEHPGMAPTNERASVAGPV